MPAKAAPYTVILRRKPTDWFHVPRWNTQTDALEHGTWYAGTLHPKRADGTYRGGGHWESEALLRLNGWFAVVYKFRLDALASGQPTTVIDLEHLAPPPV